MPGQASGKLCPAGRLTRYTVSASSPPSRRCGARCRRSRRGCGRSASAGRSSRRRAGRPRRPGWPVARRRRSSPGLGRRTGHAGRCCRRDVVAGDQDVPRPAGRLPDLVGEVVSEGLVVEVARGGRARRSRWPRRAGPGRRARCGGARAGPSPGRSRRAGTRGSEPRTPSRCRAARRSGRPLAIPRSSSRAAAASARSTSSRWVSRSPAEASTRAGASDRAVGDVAEHGVQRDARPVALGDVVGHRGVGPRHGVRH